MARSGATLAVKGYREFQVALAGADKESRAYTRGVFRQVGEGVRKTAAARFAPVSMKTALGYKVGVTRSGIRVEQGLRKTTGKRPDYGSLQMRRALLPALAANEDRLMRDLDQAFDRVADHFNSGGP